MKIGYFIKSRGRSIADTFYFREIDNLEEADERDLVYEACLYAWNHRDSWEWLQFDEIITLVCDGVELGDFPVEITYLPTFDVSEKIEKVK